MARIAPPDERSHHETKRDASLSSTVSTGEADKHVKFQDSVEVLMINSRHSMSERERTKQWLRRREIQEIQREAKFLARTSSENCRNNNDPNSFARTHLRVYRSCFGEGGLSREDSEHLEYWTRTGSILRGLERVVIPELHGQKVHRVNCYRRAVINAYSEGNKMSSEDHALYVRHIAESFSLPDVLHAHSVGEADFQVLQIEESSSSDSSGLSEERRKTFRLSRAETSVVERDTELTLVTGDEGNSPYLQFSASM
mmetsp:Transcript_18276/g.26239  ORF Transcript_18276/g.26239 Transcript_18276/m.26239 type:complete len:256 (+) Transcript_18276:182-949(+)|eukprot:CAMPEP_0202465318 /NCGR_PEP_ID=MMETSP1360-20130828/65163_1 /ASSEMBLY_ACC=CAM_ASM_000848 /TAXON_ID=515479 /ORGANISM="Licmophora paradoxa, Strain CCMP2313" /LENGTH=255 /DNA_ID=CAMNT_0049089001 /DNA_START=179 /DNA_END=946 /DNA_ORIENTATION=-